MILNTRHFGEIEIDENNIIDFPNGILAFEDIKKYIVINNPNDDIPFQWLQSVDNPDLAFVIANPYLFVKEYEFDIPEKVINKLKIENPKDIMIYSIAVVPEELKDMTINLKAPIVININKKLGKQIVLENDKFQLKYKIFKEIKQSD